MTKPTDTIRGHMAQIQIQAQILSADGHPIHRFHLALHHLDEACRIIDRDSAKKSTEPELSP